jgi:hypothetical protein
MCKKKLFYACLLLTLIIAGLLFLPSVEPSRVHAQDLTPVVDHGTCIKCHEDLYFLYDTGNWFCIRESPMRCVDCHGGNPSSLKQGEAHTTREIHPVINEDVSKCQECHPEQCSERVARFDQVAGISNVLVAVPYQPATQEVVREPEPVQEDPASPSGWTSAMEVITPFFWIGLVVVVYLIHRRKTNKSNKET